MSKISELLTFTEKTPIDDSVFFQGTKHQLWQENANTTKNWFATDTMDRINSKYQGADITYKFNSDGYRCDELQPSDFLFLGCSYSIGVGLPVDDVWAKIIADRHSAPYVNISWPGAGAAYMGRLLAKTIDAIRPKYVIGLFPYNFRMELMLSDGRLGVFTKTSGMINLLPAKDKDRMNAFMLYSSSQQEDFELLTNVMHMSQLSNAYGAKFLWGDWVYRQERSDWYVNHRNQIPGYIDSTIMDNHTRWESLDTKARDSTHPGKAFHLEFADIVGNHI